MANLEDVAANKDKEEDKKTPVRPKLVKYSNAGELLPSILQAEFGESADDNLGAFLKMVKDKGASKGGTTYDHDMFYKKSQEDEDAFIEGLSGFVKPTFEKAFPADKVVEEKAVTTPKETATKNKKTDYTSSSITTEFVSGLKEGDIIFVDGVERVKQNGVLKKVKR